MEHPNSQALTLIDQIMHGPYRMIDPDLDPANCRVGVDLGTANTVITVLDQNCRPIAGAYQFAQVVRDGLVVDYFGAVNLVSKLKEQLENQLGFELTSAATAYPPGVPLAEVRATANVLEAAGLSCTEMIDEPSAANQVLNVQNGAIVDVGGGTTGTAILKDGKVIHSADDATGGTHFSLTLAGALNVSFEEAEQIKTTASEQERLFPVVRPVMEKVASIIQKHIANYEVDHVYLVGGTCKYPGMAKVVQNFLQIECEVPDSPLFVTPLGIAMSHQPNHYQE
jgi:ethanolamine utilization protein EutJ